MSIADGPTDDRSPGPSRRSWPQRLVIVAGGVLAVGCLLSACTVWYVGSWYAGLHRISIVHAPAAVIGAAPDDAVPNAPTSTTEDSTPAKAMNILVTGSDGRSCIDPDSPYAGAFLGSGSDIGARSDTIIVLHLDPASKQLALLSFPRDLWVPIAGTGGEDRINAAFDAADPSGLIQTIETDFGLRIDHYVGVDFCAFKSLVDAAGGLSIPFDHPARDRHTGLYVAAPGCAHLDGDEALAYVRSRYYEYQDDGRWISDPTSDYGRIARQQDFLRRLADAAFSAGVTDPLTAKHLFDVASSNDVHIDDGLSLSDLVRIARSVKDIGANRALGYRIPGTGQIIGGASVIVPDLDGADTQAILRIFRGQSPAAAPTKTLDAAAVAPATVAPADASVQSNVTGVAPPVGVSC